MQILPGVLQTATLRDGRVVGYSVCGAPNGNPVLFLHPMQGNRYMTLTMHEAAMSFNLKIIALDRPGIGTSSPQPQRKVADYPADVLQLCQQLDIHQFSIMASSAGTMYALACTLASETKDMVVGKVTLIAPWIPPSSRPGTGSWLSSLTLWVPVPLLQAVVGFINNRIVQQSKTCQVTDLMTRSNQQERAAFAAQPSNDSIYKAMIDQWNASLSGIIQEMQLCMERSHSLHFQYQKVRAPVRVFMGTDDQVLQHKHVQQWADTAEHRNVELISVPQGTHDGLMHTHKVVALDALSRDLQ